MSATARKTVLAAMFTGGLLGAAAPLLLSPQVWLVAMSAALHMLAFVLTAIATEARIRLNPVSWPATLRRCAWSLVVGLGLAGVCTLPIVLSGMMSLPSQGLLFVLATPFGALLCAVPFWGSWQFDKLEGTVQYPATA